MTLDELAAMAARVPELERRIAELEAHNSQPDALAFTVKEVAERFLPGVPESTIRAWIAQGKLRARTYPGSDSTKKLVLYDDIRAFLASLPTVDDAPPPGASVEEATRRILAKHNNRKVG